jgi:hypothetical protein
VAIAGKRARATARRHTGSRSGGPWPGQCWRDSITGSSSGSSSSRSVKPATRRQGRQHRAVPGRSPASGLGRRRGSTPASDRGCCGLVVVPGCWQASVAYVCQGCRRRGPCWRDSITGKRCQGDGETAHRRPIGVAVAWSGSRAVLNHRQAGQGDGETAHRRPIGVAAAWSRCRAAGRHRLPAWPVLWRRSITGKLALLWSGRAARRAVRPGLRPLDR